LGGKKRAIKGAIPDKQGSGKKIQEKARSWGGCLSGEGNSSGPTKTVHQVGRSKRAFYVVAEGGRRKTKGGQQKQRFLGGSKSIIVLLLKRKKSRLRNTEGQSQRRSAKAFRKSKQWKGPGPKPFLGRGRLGEREIKQVGGKFAESQSKLI